MDKNKIIYFLFACIIILIVLLLHTTKENAILIGEFQEKSKKDLYKIDQLEMEISDLQDWINDQIIDRDIIVKD